MPHVTWIFHEAEKIPSPEAARPIVYLISGHLHGFEKSGEDSERAWAPHSLLAS